MAAAEYMTTAVAGRGDDAVGEMVRVESWVGGDE